MSLLEVDRPRIGWWLFGVGLAVAMVFVLHAFIGTVVFGVFIYYATRPIYRRLEGHFRRIRLGRSIAAAISIFALALPALVLVMYALVITLRELDRLTRTAAFDLARYPGIDQELLDSIADPQRLVERDFSGYLTDGSLDAALGGLAQATDTLAFLGIGLVHLFVMVALAFFLLRDDSRLVRRVTRTFRDETGVLQEYMRRVDRDFHGIFFGNILNAVLTGTIGVIAYSLLNAVAPPGVGIPVPALVGALTGVASLIPVVGMKLVYVPLALYLAAVAVIGGGAGALGFVGLFAIVSFVFVDTLPDLVLRPYVSGRSLHVGSLMLAYTLGPLLFGWYGIFLLPMVFVLAVHFVDVALPELLAGVPLEPRSIDPGNVMESPPPDATSAGGESTPADRTAPTGEKRGSGDAATELDRADDGGRGDGDVDRGEVGRGSDDAGK